MTFSHWILITGVCSLVPWIWRFSKSAEPTAATEVAATVDAAKAPSVTQPQHSITPKNVELAAALLASHTAQKSNPEALAAFQKLTIPEQVTALLKACEALPARSYTTSSLISSDLQRAVLALLPKHRDTLGPLLRHVDLCPELEAYYTQWGREDLVGFVRACQGKGMSRMRDRIPALVEENIGKTTPKALMDACLDEETRDCVLGAVAAARLDENTDILTVLETLMASKTEGISKGLNNGGSGVFLNKLQKQYPERLAHAMLDKPGLFTDPYVHEFFVIDFARKTPTAAATWLNRCREMGRHSYMADAAEAVLTCEAMRKSPPQEAANLWLAASLAVQSRMCSARLLNDAPLLTEETHQAVFAALPDDAARDHMAACLVTGIALLPPSVLTDQWKHMEAALKSNMEAFSKLQADVIVSALEKASPEFRNAYESFISSQTPFIKALKKEDFATAMENLPSTLPKTLEESTLVKSIAEMTRLYPEGLRQWVTSLPKSEEKNTIVANYVHNWAVADPMGAEAFVRTLPLGKEQGLGHFRLHALSTAQGDFTAAERHLRDCLAALKDHPESPSHLGIDRAVHDFVKIVSETKPDLATTLRNDPLFRPLMGYLESSSSPAKSTPPPRSYWEELLMGAVSR